MGKSVYPRAAHVFDKDFGFVTSPILSPRVLGGMRVTFCIYILITILVVLVVEYLKKSIGASYLSYFTHLSAIGQCAYFAAAGIQTLSFSRKKKEYPLQRWPRLLQGLHALLYCTITTFPLLVSIVFWILLSSPTTFATPESSWSNISQHVLNSVFALFEISCTNASPFLWINLLFTLLLLAGYLGIAYITHASQNIYPYSFLDPKKEGKKLILYIVGIAVGQCVVFVVARYAIVFRREFVDKRLGAYRQTLDGDDTDTVHMVAIKA